MFAAREETMDDCFVEYPKIWTGTGSLKKASVEQMRQVDSVDWVVTEKIHGANICWISNGEDVVCARRRGLLAPQENFFGHKFLEGIQDQTRAAFGVVKQEYPDLKYVYVYGEIFGGFYEHPEVPQQTGIRPVQTEVQYCPQVGFYAFDLGLAMEGTPDEECELVGYEEATKVFSATGINHLQPLFVGGLNAGMNYPLSFNSTIPAILGLPPLEDNLAEGVVVKPMQKLYVELEEGETIRPCFKIKNPSFCEKQHLKKDPRPSQTKEFKTGEASALETLKFEAACLVTDNRLTAAISKHGFPSSKSSKESKVLFHEIMNDVMEELSENHELYHALSANHVRALRGSVQGAVGKLLKEFFSRESEHEEEA